MPSKPHILFIILDTLRRDHLSLYGYARSTSPALEDFAQRALTFQRAISPAQWTIPAHASLFTGLYPAQHGLTQAFGTLSAMHPTLAEILRQADYQTVAFCNNPLLGLLDHGLQRGFEHFYNYAGATPNRPIDSARSPLRRRLAQRLRRTARAITNRFAHNDLLFRISLNPLVVPIWTRLANFKGDSPRALQDFVDYWRAYHVGGAERPLFAFLNLMGAHTPYRPPRAMLERFAPDVVRSRAAHRFVMGHNADAAHWISPADGPLEDWQRAALAAFYDAEIAHQDAALGRALADLQAQGLLDDTLIIIAADHGEGHGDHGFFGHSFVVHHELVHVPLLLRFPDHPLSAEGLSLCENVSTRRLFHTILDAAQVCPPLAADDPNANVQGLSLRRTLEGRDPEGGLVFSQAVPPQNLLNVLERHKPHQIERLGLRQTRQAVLQRDDKLLLLGDRPEALYNLADDPYEAHNLLSAAPQRALALQAALSRWQRSATAVDQVAQDFSAEVVANLRALGYMD
ncbi:MAG: sulfatase [Anaerolineae bacterium]|nr:sulfatase [Anaerolineae bacterium]MDW8172895.1 sulfatase [Anaerolineae bacterium]